MHRERFAPSPTGELHLGTAFSAMIAKARARAAGGTFLIRIEDIDRTRCRPEHAERLLEDLAWLGLGSDEPVLYQSTRTAVYRSALDGLTARGLTYPCTCTRRDIAEAASAPQEGVPGGPDGPVYPGTCRGREGDPEGPHAIRLDMERAVRAAAMPLSFGETGEGPEGETGTIPVTAEHLVEGAGDVVLWRKDGSPAYHLAVTIDDAFQRISHVTRGQDLFSSTPVHRMLQALLGLPVPVWHHHRLIRDDGGKRLAKRDDARSIRSLREAGATPADIARMLRTR